MPVALQGLSPAALRALVPILDETEARKIVSAAHRGSGVDAPVRGVRRASLEAVRAIAWLPSLTVRAERASALDPFRKLLVETHDGHRVETVRIPLERAGRFSVCVSSQVGCALGCTFCATGRMGLRRNLEAWEIVEQVRLVRATLDGARGERVHGVVFQGMGEPLANLDRVLEAIAVLTEPSAQAIDGRAITVCTAGVPSGIRRLAAAAPKIRLGISLGTAVAARRRALMPVDGANPLAEVIDAAVEHARVTGLAPLWALTPLAGVNDSDEDAAALAALFHDFTARAGLRPRLSVIPYNAIADDGSDPFRRASDESLVRFRDALRAAGVPSHLRYSGGSDVSAACGQLAARD